MSTVSKLAKQLDVKEAAKKSIEAFGSVFPKEIQEDLRLEEITLNDKETEWTTTISFKSEQQDEQDKSSVDIEALFGRKPKSRRRTYKSIRVRASDGKLLGIMNAA